MSEKKSWHIKLKEAAALKKSLMNTIDEIFEWLDENKQGIDEEKWDAANQMTDECYVALKYGSFDTGWLPRWGEKFYALVAEIGLIETSFPLGEGSEMKVKIERLLKMKKSESTKQ